MPISYSEIRKFLGRFRQANSFNTPDGALEIGDNITLNKDNVITKRRGFYQYFDPAAQTPARTLNNVALYQNTLINLYANAVAYLTETGTVPNKTATHTVLTGETVSISGGRYSRSIESNKNLYFTTDDGAFKLEAFNGTVFKSGIPPGIDVDVYSNGAGFLPNLNYVGYRVVFGRRDANDNLLLSAPSDVFIFFNNSGGAVRPRVEFSIPSEITDGNNFFYQIYRTSFATVVPPVNFRLVEEIKLTTAQITNRVAFYDDDVDDAALSDAELYTNPNSREGELQANARPPLCDDLTLFKGHVLYGKCTTRHLLSLNLITVTTLANNDYIEIKTATSSARRYIFKTDLGNKTTPCTGAGAGTITVTTPTAHGFASTDVIYASNISGTLAEGEYVVTVTGATTFTITSGAATAATLNITGLRNASGQHFAKLLTTGTVSENLTETAAHLVKAVNRDASSLVYANYVSSIADTPGMMRFQAKGFGAKIQVASSTTTVGQSFSPIVTTTFADTESKNEDQKNVLYSSKTFEPEAVPLVNFFPVGAGEAEICRIAALRDSVIIVKTDGVFRLTGDNPTNFAVTALDSTIACVNANFFAVINNQVVFLSNEGVCLVTDSSVKVISRRVEDDFQPIQVLPTISTFGGAISYESERLVIMTTLTPDNSSTSHVYNVLNETWTTWSDIQLTAGVVGPSDRFYGVSTSGKLLRERKENTKIDYSDQNYTVTINSVASDSLSLVLTSASVVPEAGDALVASNTISRINSVTSLGSNQYSVDFKRPTNITTMSSVILYDGIESTIKFAPFHAGQISRGKQFTQWQIHLRNNVFSRVQLSFANNAFQSSGNTDWLASSAGAAGQGWGLEAWGFFPWGDQELINIDYATNVAPIVRTYVPFAVQRGTFIQAQLIHTESCEAMSIQAVVYTVRGYGERVSK